MAYRSSIAGDTPGALITSATPATALVAEIEATMAAHDNWDFVEEILLSSRIRRIWKNRGTGLGANSFGQDFYVSISRDTLGTGEVTVSAFEVWNLSTAATNPSRVIRPVAGSTTNQAENVNGSFGDETLGIALNSSVFAEARLPTVTTGMDFGVLVTNNFFAAFSKYSTTDVALYAGLFDSLMPVDPFPLCLIGNSGYNNIYSSYDAATSREPNKPATHTSDTWNFISYISTWTTTSGTTQQIDPYLGGPLPSRAQIRKGTDDLANFGLRRGLLKDCVYLADGGTTTRNGDTITIAGQRYVKMKFGSYGLSNGVFVNVGAI